MERNYKTVLVNCDNCGEKELPATQLNDQRPQTRGHKCKNCGMCY